MLEKSKYNNLIKSNAGFTLMEVFIAMSVLSIGVVGAFSVLPAMIKNQTMNADKFLASQIANEGMELVRNLRDNNFLTGQNWETGLTSCAIGDSCEIDYNDTAMQINDRFLQIDPSNGFYNYGVGPNSKFKRKITISTADPTLLNVKVRVSWNGKGSPFLIEENFYDWQ
ncbi:MAG: prepilin-type N-terminal cleavage/methylation domain-containing protein [bacterium]|nr:prepilin-type N-terminal cleavage/methylation domain-containing protein [bacterium]